RLHQSEGSPAGLAFQDRVANAQGVQLAAELGQPDKLGLPVRSGLRELMSDRGCSGRRRDQDGRKRDDQGGAPRSHASPASSAPSMTGARGGQRRIARTAMA